MSDVSDLEAEAAATRARLNDTIGRIQDKLTLSGMVDEFVGRTAAPKLLDGQEFVSGLLRRHPLPVMIAAAGIGFIVHRMNRRKAAPQTIDEDIDVAALNTGRARTYDPDQSSRHPLADGADAKRIEA